MVATLTVAGCGGDSGSGGETTAAEVSTATESTTSSDQQAESTTGGSEGSDSAGKQRSNGGSKSGGGGGGSKSGGKAVEIVDFDFGPPELTVAAGTKVRFKNEDAAPHTATASEDPDIFDTGTLAGGKSATVKLKKPGKYPYFCTIHPYMKASLTVK